MDLNRDNYLIQLANVINENWDQPALTDFYLTKDGSTQDISRGNHYTYGEMYAEILRLGELFQSLGIKQGDHIAICGANSSNWLVAYLAVVAYQGVAVTIMHTQSPEDIAHQIDFSDAKALFTYEDLWMELNSKPLPQVEHVISLGNWSILQGKEITNHHTALTDWKKSQIINRDCQFSIGDVDNLSMICFTSGSTEVAKGVMFSIRSLSSGLNMVCDSYPVLYNRNVLSILPFAHVLAFGGTIATLLQGCHEYIMASAFTPTSFATSVLLTRPSIIHIIPQLIPILLNPQFLDAYYAGVGIDYLVVGGAKCSLEWIIAAQEKKLPITIGYGLTEMCVISTSMPSKYKPGTTGQLCKVLSCRIESNGEILIKGDEMMLGYYKDPEATARKIDKDGWLHTGDKGHLDEDGYLYVEGRLEQDMIVLPNGENIHPEDIERKINALPEVKESIVLARDGKLVAIVVAQITNDQSPMTNTDLRRMILRNVNPELPLYSQLYDVEITDTPLAKTEKQTIKRYLYR